MRNPFIKVPFASSGDKSVIPDAAQPNGSISMQSGWGVDYEKEVGVDPAAKSVNRQDMNQVLNLATALLNRWQTETFPEWIDSASNGGSPYSYPLGSVVRYSADGIAPYLAWVNTVANNATSPSEPNGWILFSDAVSRSRQATETVQGTMEVGTQAEVNSGVSDTVAVTPLKLRAGFSFQASTNGYFKFPSWLGGFIIQWGLANTDSAGKATFTFATPFPTGVLGITSSYSEVTSAINDRVYVQGVATTTTATGYVSTAAGPGIPGAAVRFIVLGN